jgi:hypothetical protein
VREVEERAADQEAKRQRAEGQLSTLVYNLDKAEAVVKQKEVDADVFPAGFSVMIAHEALRAEIGKMCSGGNVGFERAGQDHGKRSRRHAQEHATERE